MRNAKKMKNEVSKGKMEKVEAKEKNEVLSANCYSKKKKVQSLSIKIDLNPGHHTTF